ncbi:hypothetical protein [Streptomyces phaeochromogenes]|uniref:hypothetical protein n=1 Tax=Streptomyces phaeochromogenes TaxID=1923 RepID=UPI002DD871DA|nr:hypothetical protein [Streptomyces phaeochromogenes]WRZ32220.1 hypothetical protein OG931_33080 [Streptomyces phaeochromogenes]
MKARTAEAGRLLSRGTWNALEAWGLWLSGASHADRHGLLRLGVILRRLVLSLLAAIFYAGVVTRSWQLVYLAPLAWAAVAWQMSDWSATPPPRGVAPESDIDAARRRKAARGVYDPNGVMCITHPPREEVNEA